ncbi:spore germination protein KA [Salinibacillus kushneri]|uniref:Spore germination protein KA n=1 Tax=Salinibacillus kushneri TaxID=237682 RepID=A0A1I0FCP5_9BACI|nr:spore germination protein [Salinibacillus kushneri]SET55299.1 spore germination protein KA [Salinibacillus kushneri]
MKKKFWSFTGKYKKKTAKPNQDQLQTSSQHQQPLLGMLQDDVKYIQSSMGSSADFETRFFQIGTDFPVEAAIIYIDGLVDKNFVHNFIMETLMVDIRTTDQGQNPHEVKDILTQLKSRSLAASDVTEVMDYKSVFEQILSGNTVLLLNGFMKGLAISSPGYDSRNIEEPSSQTVVRGPKEGFTEVLKTNTSLIRRRIKNPNLWIESRKIGQTSNTEVAVCYINGIANDDIVQEVNRRLDNINIDGILESGYIEELIQDETFTPFPTLYNTERPDSICAGLLEGRVAILVDGTPFALLAPTVFIHYFQATEDYYQRSDIGSLMRLLRFLCFFLALLTPSAYIALTTFHQEMIPTPLLISLAAQREGVPFPAFFEALMMEITFEILREAGTRMPRAVGSAISIVGALVLGQAAVEAGIVSSAMVIVVSLTAISSFVTPAFNMTISIRILRFGFMTLAAVFGLIGIILGLIIMILHLTSLRSFGVPYLAPMGPFITSDQKDTLLRLPFWKMRERQKLINKKNVVRENTPSPKPPGNKN